MATTAVDWTVRFNPEAPTAVVFLDLRTEAAVARLSPDWLLGRRDEVCSAGLTPDPQHPDLHVSAGSMRQLIATLDRCAGAIVPRPDPRLLAPVARRADALCRPTALCA